MQPTSSAHVSTRHGFALLIAACLCLVSLVVVFSYNSHVDNADSIQMEMLRRQQTLIREIAAVGSDAARGISPDFRTISDYRAEFHENVLLLRDGDIELDIAPLPAALHEGLNALVKHWAPVDTLLRVIIDSRRVFADSAHQQDAVRELAAEITEAITRRSDRRPTSTERRAQLAELLWRLESLTRSIHALEHSARPSAEELADLQRMATEWKRRASDEANAEQLDDGLNERAKRLHALLLGILDHAPQIVAARRASADVATAAANVLSHAIEAERQLATLIRNRWINANCELALAGSAIAFLSLAILVFFKDAQRRSLAADEARQRQQKAILALLDQITILADGDLTVEFEVTADFTGAIADSINHTVATLRRLVGTINSTSVEVASAAHQTRTSARAMNDASNDQARRIGAISEKMSSVSGAIKGVSVAATDLATSARESVAVARDGAETTGNVISGMDRLRGRILDTADRIQRLTGHSEEVEGIVEYVHDIADQTSTLALNASIQAANAGAQGRGFAVVADEVQRLAEHAGRATRQIEQLMRSIQADTQAARLSMERSIREVDSGSTAAEKAGEMLTRIESRSASLAGLIDRIAADARLQSEATIRIANGMRSMKTVAEHTSGSAGRTAEEINVLTDLSSELRRSVEGFRLPVAVAGTTHQIM